MHLSHTFSVNPAQNVAGSVEVRVYSAYPSLRSFMVVYELPSGKYDNDPYTVRMDLQLAV